jgi:hypothetical protein
MELCYFSFLPHCTHELKPLNRSIYGTLKKFVNSTCDTWLRIHTDKLHIALTANKFSQMHPRRGKSIVGFCCWTHTYLFLLWLTFEFKTIKFSKFFIEKFSHFKLEFSCQQSAVNIRLKHKSFTFRRNLHRASPVEIRRVGALRESRRQEIRVNVVLTDTPVKVRLEAKADVRDNPVKCNRLFSDITNTWTIWRTDCFEEED